MRIELNEMSVFDKIHLINEIWESMEDNNNQIISPKWHKEVLLSRKERVENGDAKFKSFEEVKKELKKKFKWK
ncbi:MAG: addiction module protein [Flavobacteriaceae bacterium]|nr:addiction module protein [Flavobacteriaceae bacterium]